jgi:hypothetical protein
MRVEETVEELLVLRQPRTRERTEQERLEPGGAISSPKDFASLPIRVLRGQKAPPGARVRAA